MIISDSSEIFEKVKAKQQYIPGLNYAGNKKQTLEATFGLQAKQNKPVSQFNHKRSGQSTPLLPTPSGKPMPQYVEDNR